MLIVLLSGCTSTPPACDRSCVSALVAQRTGFSLGPQPCNGQVILPNGASLEDGLTEEEAVLVALWNNAAFQEQLADLGIARGDLVQAGLLPNPEFLYLSQVSHKPYRYAIDLPLEAFWLRPIRVRAAAGESARVGDRLTQAALDLIRDVRQAYADVLLAQGRLQVAQEAVRIRGQISQLAEARLKAGDISPQEATTARIDAFQAQQDLARVGYDVSLAQERLRNLLALGEDRRPLMLDPGPANCAACAQVAHAAPPQHAGLDAERLTAEAVASRPDALAAGQNAAAAAERLRLSRVGWVRFLGIADATSGERTGHEFGPGFRVTLPVFNRNQGNIARAEAELERAERQRQTVRNQIVLDVYQAHYRYAQAGAELEVLDARVLPEVKDAIRRTELAYREGNTPYVVVLETTRQLLDSRLRWHQLQAELRRAWAELERSVGRRLLLVADCGTRIADCQTEDPWLAIRDPQSTIRNARVRLGNPVLFPPSHAGQQSQGPTP
ncbi:MAG: TolC family protein [Gemmataceae bacterium]|nr:TolC family protein [Gemmataceae bacterium]